MYQLKLDLKKQFEEYLKVKTVFNLNQLEKNYNDAFIILQYTDSSKELGINVDRHEETIIFYTYTNSAGIKQVEFYKKFFRLFFKEKYSALSYKDEVEFLTSELNGKDEYRLKSTVLLNVVD